MSRHGNGEVEQAGPSSPREAGTADSRRILTTIYVALALGVAMLAIVFYAVGPAAGVTGSSLLRWIWLAAAVVCSVGAGFLRGRSRVASSDLRSVLPAAVVAWSLAEAQALLAAIGFFLTGDLLLLAAGLVLFVFLMARHRPGVFLDRS